MTNIYVFTMKGNFKIAGTYVPDHQFLVIIGKAKIWRFPWTNVIVFSIDKEDN